jgi:hypothetical protein
MPKNALRNLYWILMLSFLLISPSLVWPQSAGSSTGSGNTTKAPGKEKKDGALCMHHCNSAREISYDLNNRSYSGETVRGPATIVAKNLNILRYKYTANSKVTLSKAPDLWSELTGIANPQSSPSGSAPAQAQAPAAGASHAMNLVIKSRGPKAQAEPGGLPVSVAAQAVNDKVKKAIDEASQAIADVNVATSGINETLKNGVETDFVSVSGQVKRANTATDSVNAAGQELLSFLKSIDASSTYSGIQGELAQGSKFTVGLSAQWPSSADVANLKTSVDQRKTLLGQLKTDLDGKQASLLSGLSTAERDLYAASEALEQLALQVQGTSKKTGDQTVIDADRQLLTTATSGVDQSKQQLTTASGLLNWATAENNQMETSLSNLDGSGDKFKAFQQAQAQLSDWQQQMVRIKTAWDLHSAQGADQTLNPDPFAMHIPGTCNYAFASTKQTVITLTATDLLPDKSAAAPATVLSVTVECASPFNVSAGVAFSTIPDREYAIQPVATPPGSTTTTNQFALTANSSFHPLVLGMVSARLCEPNEIVAFHLSFGLAGNFKSQNAGGSSAEFLIGPSISLFRTMFITPGLHIGKKTVLADGYSVGSPVPPNVTTVPLQSSYKPAFGLAITFTKP